MTTYQHTHTTHHIKFNKTKLNKIQQDQTNRIKKNEQKNSTTEAHKSKVLG